MPTLQIVLVPISLIAISCIWVSIANAEMIDVPTVSIDPVAAATTVPSGNNPTSSNPTSTRPSSPSTRREAIAATAAERRIQLSSRNQERIINLAANVSNRFDAAITRLQNISDRMATRAAKMEAVGYDITPATQALQTANSNLAQARLSLSTIDTMVIDTVRGADVARNWQRTKEQFSAIRSNIIFAHTNLRQGVVALKNPDPRTASTSDAMLE